MNVLSLFDGMSCGQIALERAGIKVTNYFASEIDKHAIAVTQHNYPNTIQLGDVTKIDFDSLPEIDLIIGGSPCQGFSFAGKQLNFEDPRSKLFFEFVNAVDTLIPRYFFLENVKMKKEYQDVISKLLGVEPLEVNSSLVSAQNRKRIYWTNIPNFVMPKDRQILLKSVIINGLVDRDKSLCLTQRYAGFAGSASYLRRRYFGKSMGQAVFIESIAEHKSAFLKDPFQEHENLKGIRGLNKTECLKLQTIPENYLTDKTSLSEARRMTGNGWTVDVIVEFFKNIEQ